MGVRLLAAGVASLAVIGMFAVMVQVSSQARRASMAPQNTSTLASILNQARDSSASGPEPEWIVTKANSAHHAMVVEVEARRLDEARAIAIQIVKPLRSRGYQEILIYVRRPRSGVDDALRRIQWTRSGGFVETAYDALP
ncbi:MAG: hypothetical protein HYX77_02445 [Acidobacteria bacterium]|nr:hypothetical protein [Acidobacteriota bacterium]